MNPRPWLIAADTGGTFTDCWALDPEGVEHRCKLLSSGRLRTVVVERISATQVRLRENWASADRLFCGFHVELGSESRMAADWSASRRLLTLDAPLPEALGAGSPVELFTGESAPVLAARLLTATPLGAGFPSLEFRLSTTRATNALLEGQAAQPVFFVTAGFADLLEIGDQRRPDLFALGHQKQRLPLAAVEEVDERLDAAGSVLRKPDLENVRRAAARHVATGQRVAAVAFAHSFRNPTHELAVKEVLLSEGFEQVSVSSELSPLIRLLPRAQTAVVDAALTPVMADFVRSVSAPLAGAGRFFCVSSAGSLTAPARFHAKDSLLSGPAGGVAGCAAVARAAGVGKILTLDMGGTSTDVARWEGAFVYQFEQRIGSACILSPSLKIETVAAGGGSICEVTEEGLSVGPRSAGAAPGPACYGRGGPLTLTDVNLLLGRLDPDKAAVPLWPEAARRRLDELKVKLAAHGWPVPERDEELLSGLLDIAIERMAEAVRRISVREGCDPRDYALVAFGGAGPQHACAVADRLGIRTILAPRNAGLLSAFGAGQAPEERVAERQILRPLDMETLGAIASALTEMEAEVLAALPGSEIQRRLAEVRLKGQDAALTLEFSQPEDLAPNFQRRYQELYGYAPAAGRTLELATLRVFGAVPSAPMPSEAFPSTSTRGPMTVQDRFSTLIIGPGWRAMQGSLGTWRLERGDDDAGDLHLKSAAAAVEAELFRCRFAGLVDAMGALLQRTAISTNVKERLDFSCALLDAQGRLVMNAPHIPVHLGALGECVRQVVKALPPRPGDLLVTNDPAFAGSHLPDVTVICPVFADDGSLLAYTANRAHHAEIGGIAPGSMPAFAAHLAEEGVVIPPTLLARDGDYFEERMAAILSQQPNPTRALSDNLADLRAQAAAARHGAEAILRLSQQFGPAEVRSQMGQILTVSGNALMRKLTGADLSGASAEERLDDGWRIAVAVRKEPDGALAIDFTGSGPVHPGSRNATLAVVRSAALYVLRLWLAADIPLNEGLMDRVRLIVPPGFLNPRFNGDPRRSPAVVAGNVETSQRIVDALLRAFGIEACSQGTMNNVIFGDAHFGHYETLCGGSGAGPGYHGASALHTHMTNTAITDIEVLEHRYPVRIGRFAVRLGSGGAGRWRGGNGVVREYAFLSPVAVSILTEHRNSAPYGLQGGGPGMCGRQEIIAADGTSKVLPGSVTLDFAAGDRLLIQTPGGGGWGKPDF